MKNVKKEGEPQCLIIREKEAFASSKTEKSFYQIVDGCQITAVNYQQIVDLRTLKNRRISNARKK